MDKKKPVRPVRRASKTGQKGTVRAGQKAANITKDEITALLEASRSILRFRDFADTSRAIFDSCKNLIGASAGYIALLSNDGMENEVVFLDPGNYNCTVEQGLPMPIRGLRGKAYRSKKTVYHNDFQKSPFLKFMPAGHVAVENVLFAPLIIDDKTAGLLGLANKPGGFTEKDAHMASAFGDLASIALQNSRFYMSLLREEERFRSLAEAATDAIVSADGGGNIIFWNRGAEKIFGYKRSDILGREIVELMPERFRSSHLKGLADGVSAGNAGLSGRTLETFALRKDGTEFPVELSLARWSTGDGVFFTSIIREITERRRYEGELEKYRTGLEDLVMEKTGELRALNEELENEIARRKRSEKMLRHSHKMQAVGQLTGGIAHDFNNRLAAIMNYSYLLLMKLRDEDPLKTHVSAIHSIAENAASLTHSLLTFSSKQVIDPKSVDLNGLIRNVEKILQRVMGEDIVVASFLNDEPLTSMVDVSQVENVMLNLATNARDAMPDGGTLMIEAGEIELDVDYIQNHGWGKPGRFALISFGDSGKGMDKETSERIFEPFFTTKEPGKGTGLGLSMVYGIVMQHGGGISVYSEPDKGTVFKIYLPLIQGGIVDRDEGAAGFRGGTETILFAEDDRGLRTPAKEIFEKFGYRVLEAGDGEEAVRMFAENRDSIDLLLCDAMLPLKNGREVFEEARRIRPDIKVLFMSGYTANIIHKKGVLEEGLNFVSKPAQPNKLLKKIREVLDA